MDDKKTFWSTLPGILTGFAAVITAITAGYIAITSSQKGAISTGGKPPLSSTTNTTSPSDWPLIAEETFTKELTGWSIGNYSSEETPRFDLRLVDGNYRWDLEYSKKWHRWVICPIGSAINFDYSVDVKLTESAPDATANLLFSFAGNEYYAFTVSANGKFGLIKTSDGKEQMLIGWTPINNEFKPDGWNRMEVVVDRQLIGLYLNSELLGEYRDVVFTGGKVGLGVTMYQKGTAVVDFDNLKFRRKP